ncbi:phosphotransferase family protein [Alicyclobacillus macrosporangiidus]|uniref:phosphotransferase family protein n=1 Tax=Alicyclobacillus macrosporangiidus TaxID=392015 RepID=UPI00068C55C0|nr:aminoglycoside phosphotransferase family protein [Alicyclobacillus macrosporangiidus]
MDLRNGAEVTSYLIRKGVMAPGTRATLVPLTGGVSSEVVLVRNGRSLVLKRALAKLRVKEDWYAGTERNQVEAECLRRVSALAPDFVPELVLEDRDASLFAMEYVDGPTWKAELLAGRMDFFVPEQLGRFLGALHRSSYKNPAWLAPFESKALFYQLRVSPYFVFIRPRYAAWTEALDFVIDGLMSRSEVLVHGDFSPKNVLLRQGQPCVLDWEVAHAGHPAFDVGFLLSHLLLKAIHFGVNGQACHQAAQVFYDTYFREVQVLPEPEYRPMVMRTTGALMLARVDGKSPVEYLTPSEQEVARRGGIALLTGEVDHLQDFQWMG